MFETFSIRVFNLFRSSDFGFRVSYFLGYLFAQLSQKLVRVDASIVSITELDGIGIVAHGFHTQDS